MLDFVLGLIGTLLYPLFSIIFVFIDGIQTVFYAFAGMGDISFGGQSITGTNEGGEANTGLVYYLFQNSLVKNMLFSIMMLALFLVVIFTVMAFIKNFYAAKQKGWKDIIVSALKGLGNFILVPVCCLFGVWLANILLRAIDGATSAGGGSEMSRKLFIASAYNSNEFRTGDADASDWQDLQVFAEKHGYKNSDKITSGLSIEQYANYVDDIYATTDVAIWNQVSVGDWYQVWSINYLVLIVGGIFMLYVLCSLAFAMVRRMFMLVILFIISPGVCAMYPLDDGKAVGQWKGEFIKLVLSAYGAVAGMNIFFSIMPLIDKIQLFGGGAHGGNSTLSTLVQIFILIVGLLCVKEVISLISSFVGGEDAFSKGTATMKATTGAMKKYVGGASKKVAGAFGKARGQAAAGQGHTLTNLFKNTGKDLSNAALRTVTGFDLKDTTKSFKDARKEGKEHAFDGHDTRTAYMKKKQDAEFAKFFVNKDGSKRQQSFGEKGLREFYDFLDGVKDKKAKEQYAEKMADFNNRINTQRRGTLRDSDGNMILDYVDKNGRKHYKSGRIGGGKLQTSSGLIEASDEYKGHKKNIQYQERSLEPIIKAFKEAQTSSNVKTFATQMGVDISDVSMKNFETAMTKAITNGMFNAKGANETMLNGKALMTRLAEREKFRGEDVAKAGKDVAEAMQKFNDMLTLNATENALHDAVESLSKEVMDSAKKLKVDVDISGLENSLKDASKSISETFDKLKKLDDIK